MRYRSLGSSGLIVSEIGFGCGPGAGLMIGQDAAMRAAAVGHAVDLGITLFDTAASYGDGLSEQNLGQAIREVRASAQVATKVTLEWDDLIDIPAAVRASVEGSLRRLGRERLDILHLHNRLGSARARRPSFGSGAVVTVDDVLEAGGVLETLTALRDEGKVGLFGMSAFGGDTACIRQVICSNAFDVIMLEYNYANITAWRSEATVGARDYNEVGRFAAARGMGVMALQILGGGALLTSAAPRPGVLTPEGERLELGEGLSLPELGVRFALSNTDISTAIVGFSSAAQVQDAARFAAAGSLY